MGTANLLRKNSALQGDRADSPVVVRRDRQTAMARGAEAVPEKAAARLRVGDNQVVPSNRISGAEG
jgi:hypothetical protein